MKQNKKHPARKGIIILILFLIIVGSYLTILFSNFKPYYKIYCNDIFLGYYKNYNEYEDLYNLILKEEKEKSSYEINLFLAKEVKQEKKYIKTKVLKNYDNYSLIKDNLTKEYTIYKIMVNDEAQMYSKTKARANEIVETLKKEVKDSTKIEIESFTTQDLNSLQFGEENEEIQKTIIERNKKVTSRGTVNRTTNYNFIWPTNSTKVTSNFGERWGRQHKGIDIGVPAGTEVHASQEGKVIYSDWMSGYGYYVKIQHSNGFVTAYAHNSKLLVSVGEYVSQGQTIAYSGSTGNSTGPHCHFEIIVNGVFRNPLDYL